MGARAAIHIIVYDIASDRLRDRTASLLENVGIRVQRSVFEVRATRQRIENIVAALGGALAPGDSIRVYPLTESGIDNTIVVGSGPKPEHEEFYLL